MEKVGHVNEPTTDTPTEVPLHVRVARALGWTDIVDLGEGRYVRWVGKAPLPMCSCMERGVPSTEPCRCWPRATYQPIPPFGDETPEGWACTGPLIALREIALLFHCPGWIAVAVHGGEDARALGPCEAVAELIAAGAR